MIGNTANDQVAMLASGASQGEYLLRLDTKTTWRLTGVDPTNLGDWTEKGLPSGCTVYQDAVTGDWIIARNDEVGTILAE